MRHTSHFAKLQFGRCSELLIGVSFYSNTLYGLKGGCHNIFKAVDLPTNWLKIPKSVNITDFPIEQLLSTYRTRPKCVVNPMTKFWSMDVSGRDPVVLLWAWWVSLALSRSLFNSRHSLCRFLYNHLCLSANDTITSLVMFFL